MAEMTGSVVYLIGDFMASLDEIKTGKRKAGRRQAPYRTSWGEEIYGLHKDKDGRWRITATNERYTEADERRAVQRFRAWETKENPSDVTLSVVYRGDPAAKDIVEMLNTLDGYVDPFADNVEIDAIARTVTVSLPVPADILYPWLRDLPSTCRRNSTSTRQHTAGVATESSRG